MQGRISFEQIIARDRGEIVLDGDLAGRIDRAELGEHGQPVHEDRCGDECRTGQRINRESVAEYQPRQIDRVQKNAVQPTVVNEGEGEAGGGESRVGFEAILVVQPEEYGEQKEEQRIFHARLEKREVDQKYRHRNQCEDVGGYARREGHPRQQPVAEDE